ncbi:MAG: UDP-3-O-(3-hydroxymyristoyl)glucosamine N-acyltransferase [Hyphomonas sp.]|uniref:UDP-3-O-(3-hydroxymyristoyl)glucosamine N-acyltransferase n=1 Tax=Hyphomonas sp. TaxID=87 RepID=UPI0017A37C07|nr:UDP-3-O-(3-hydroxymyristoyl)glucosamine N-acyltransferase [Hyphomonas sp.]MBA3069673.1 UDP-3-O-(3-hydroxymyristoyl)glucosamine N-acyltransferase [Hyphomonas sp.]MBU3920514.1 UDP-3-O-(3-hydroxymyristoyl)glucosamine N-acyltransferase [Alphaproteobacteria bacterium]MBU4062514.1 UDP-3-O-(3-hydroxymyristoyl)glucosamine N-acyltransferase [Alphaproteobacteria bacterium]MBU4163865.1 UDP-3-O-(3-hydroxymyristoyl)glucosamine N-acyltransferase [Alphaproteobacteria bacterium]
MTVDTRFYAPLGALTLEAAAALTGAAVDGDATLEITGVASADTAGKGELAFIEGDNAGQVEFSAGLELVVVGEAARSRLPVGIACLVARQPRQAHSKIARALFKPRYLGPADSLAISPSARVHSGAVIYPGAVICSGAAVGEGTVIGPNAVIGPGVQIGRHGSIGAGASVNCALLGDFVTLLAGARIGETGFGVIPGPDGLEDAPHFGRVILQDHVTIGANTCIDRGVFADTIIGERTKIDNLCQIAHNVVLGRSVIVAAFGGVSGSVRVGDGSRLGGRVGIADHVVVGEGVSLAGSSGLFRDVAPGETWGGTPAKPIREWMREIAWLSKQAKTRKKD